MLKGTRYNGANALLDTNAPSLGLGAKPSDTPGSISEINPGYWAGKFDDFAIWNRVLTDDEIALLYRSGSLGYSIASQIAVPRIAVTRDAGNLNLSWPAELIGYHLEQSPNVNGPNWTAVPGVTTNGMRCLPQGVRCFIDCTFIEVDSF